MSTPVLAAVAVGVLLVGTALGWLWRGALCRRRHAHLTGSWEPAGLGTFFDDAAPDDPDRPVLALMEPAGAAEAPEAPEPAPGEFPGSAAPVEGGDPPHPAFAVKAKRASRIYHAPGSPAYARTKADVWFRSAEDAEAAGFRAPKARGTTAPAG